MNIKNAIAWLAALVLVGCSTIYGPAVTITEIRASVMRELAALHAKGMISPETDQKIEAADKVFREAADACEKALIAYKETGNQEDYILKLKAVRDAVSAILDILANYAAPSEVVGYQEKLVKADKL